MKRRTFLLFCALALGKAALPFGARADEDARSDAARERWQKLTPDERDSVLANYYNVFPLLGRQAIERGFDLPKPFGINALVAPELSDLGAGNVLYSTRVELARA